MVEQEKRVGDNDDNAVEETVEQVLVDPDAPEHGNDAPPPQTIANEPSGKGVVNKDERT